MKFLVLGGLLTVGIVVAGTFIMGAMQDDANEPSQLSSVSTPLNANLDQSMADTHQNTSTTASTQEPEISSNTTTTLSLYGNKDQSGYRVHKAINNLVLQGNSLAPSISDVINEAISNEGNSILSSDAFTSTKTYKAIAVAFMANMVETNDLFAATKSSIEDKPDDTNSIIEVSVVLYPDFAQEIINAAVITGQIDSNDALLAAISAGADPSTVSEATAAGNTIAAAGLPVNGLGGGGTGNEDLSASNN